MNTQQTDTTETAAPTKRERRPLNGVDVPSLFATINAVAQQPELAQFQFRAQNRWLAGTHSRSQLLGFSGAGGEHEQTAEFRYEADHPPVLCGAGTAPTPVEFLLHALASCITAGIGNIAAARGIELEEVEVRVEGDIDLQGLLGIDEDVRNGFQDIRLSYRIRGDASPEKLRGVVEQARARSAVYDVLTNGVSVAIDVDAG